MNEAGIDGSGASVTAAPERPTLTEEAYRELKRRIISVELEPGSQIREADATATLGLGKTPVREALLRLSFEGLVRLQSRSGYTVAPITLRSARETCDLRAVLEGETAANAALAPGDAQGALHPVEEECARAGTPDGDGRLSTDAWHKWIAAEMNFHYALARASGNEMLTRLVSGVLDSFARLCHLAIALGSPPGALTHTHEALLDAIRSHNPDEARRVTVDEVRNAETRLMQALLASDSVASANVEPTPARHTFYLDVPTTTNRKGI